MPSCARLERGRGGFWGLALVLGCLAGLAGLGSGCSRATGRSAPEPIQILSSSWEYRYGESPTDEQGRPVWAREPASSSPVAVGSTVQSGQPGWTGCGSNTKPGGRGGENVLWLRTRLPGPEVAQPTIYFLIVEQMFEAYLDGQPLYHFGQLDGGGPERRRFLGNRTHVISLPPGYVGRTLTLRIYSGDLVIGISGRARIGSIHGVISAMLRDDASPGGVGIVLCAIGLLAIGLYLPQRKDPTYLSYGGFALCMGLWLLCQMGCRNYLVDAPMAWLTVEIYALYGAVACVVRYIYTVFGRGPLGLTRILADLLALFCLGAALSVGLGLLPLLRPLAIFRPLLLLSIAYTLGLVAVYSVRRNTEARLFATGFLFSCLFAVYDTLALYSLLPRSDISFSQFGQGGFVLFLGLILGLRFRRLHSSLARAEKSLSEKVTQLEERNREVQQLNDDLHRQIEARSKDLAASILDASSSFSEIAVQILADGFVIADRYRVLRLIGQGGMGSVYEIERLTDGKHLAAKVLSIQAGKQVLARFAREAQLLAKLRHPNLVSIQDVDMTQSHMAYIVMELVAGQSLSSHASRYGEIPFATTVLHQIASALASVHSQGIVHRDLKPDNVLLVHPEDRKQLTVKLVDFGVSMMLDPRGTLPPGEAEADSALGEGPTLLPDDRAAAPAAASDTQPALQPVSATEGAGKAAPSAKSGDLSATARERLGGSLPQRTGGLTQTGVIMGTPLYMAPELRQGAKFARPASDMFSFGVLGFEILTGQLPSETPALFLTFRADRPWFPRLQSKNPAVPAALATLIERCLDPTPEHRPAAAEATAVLAALLAELPPS
ncbi:MAG TPA: protein kinase [Pseudomonadota bacterium]|nr:protein kinase [Pseudomonadota bacterium]